MGERSIYRAASGTWGFRWRVNGERVRRSGYATAGDAERVLVKLKADAALERDGVAPRTPEEPIPLYMKPFLERRETEQPRSAPSDAARWRHLEPHFGHLRPSQADEAEVLAYFDKMRAEGLSRGTIGGHVKLLSTLLSELVVRNVIEANPLRKLSKATRALLRSEYDPATTPFLEKMDDVRRIIDALPEPVNIGFAVGAYGGLRTGEALALRWENVDLGARRIQVRESTGGPVKDKKARTVPVMNALLPIPDRVEAAKRREGPGLPPLRCDGAHLESHTAGTHLRKVLKDLGLARPGFGLPSEDGSIGSTLGIGARATPSRASG